MSAHFYRCLYCCLQVADVIHRIKNAKYIYAVFVCPLDKGFYHIIGIMAVTQ
jgi:hypothetical protein